MQCYVCQVPIIFGLRLHGMVKPRGPDPVVREAWIQQAWIEQDFFLVGKKDMYYI